MSRLEDFGWIDLGGTLWCSPGRFLIAMYVHV